MCLLVELPIHDDNKCHFLWQGSPHRGCGELDPFLVMGEGSRFTLGPEFPSPLHPFRLLQKKRNVDCIIV